MRRLLLYKLTHYPVQTLRLLRRFPRHMRLRDLFYLIVKPSVGKRSGPTSAETMSRAVEHRELKDAAAALTRVPDRMLEEAMRASSAPPN